MQLFNSALSNPQLTLNSYEGTQIFQALLAHQPGNVELVRRLLASPQFISNLNDYLLIVRSCLTNDLKVLKVLLDGPRISMNLDCNSRLETSVRQDNCEAAFMLVSHSYLTHRYNPHKLNHGLFEIAIKCGHSELLDYLLADQRIKISWDRLIALAIKCGQPEVQVEVQETKIMQSVVPSEIPQTLKDIMWDWIVLKADKDGILAEFQHSMRPFDMNKFPILADHFKQLRCKAATELLKEKIMERYLLLQIIETLPDNHVYFQIFQSIGL